MILYKKAPPPLPPSLASSIINTTSPLNNHFHSADHFSEIIGKMRSSAALYYTHESTFQQQGQPHFLDACFLCQRPLTHNSDIFMYRGNTPFCSQECRQEQIERDEGSEKRWKISSKRSSKQIKSSESDANVSTTNKIVRTGTVSVA